MALSTHILILILMLSPRPDPSNQIPPRPVPSNQKTQLQERHTQGWVTWPAADLSEDGTLHLKGKKIVRERPLFGSRAVLLFYLFFALLVWFFFFSTLRPPFCFDVKVFIWRVCSYRSNALGRRVFFFFLACLKEEEKIYLHCPQVPSPLTNTFLPLVPSPPREVMDSEHQMWHHFPQPLRLVFPWQQCCSNTHTQPGVVFISFFVSFPPFFNPLLSGGSTQFRWKIDI